MRPVVGVGHAFVVFQQQRQVKIAGLERPSNKIPVVNHGLHKPLYILLRSEALCVGHLTTAPYLRQKFAWWDCARPADQRRDESVQLFQIHGAFVAEPVKSLGEIIEFGVGKLWRSHSTFLLPLRTVNLADFETPRERPSEQSMGGFVVRHQRPGLALLSLRHWRDINCDGADLEGAHASDNDDCAEPAWQKPGSLPRPLRVVNGS